MSAEKTAGSTLGVVETVNVSKLIYAQGTKVMFGKKEQTSRPALRPGDAKTFTASASPAVYYVSLTETAEVDLGLDPKKK